ncbi:BIRC6 [Branchiostoma lanceolatum]|uniref:BIRC6 protein n=1 Tax=Branchiostoma lanceolatum TaxID=7740 RepID=A0A8J9YX15_BRALA|nr:BIRC6 [Branchiostoma lanceolatum]
MAACRETSLSNILVEEFEKWREETQDDSIFLLEAGMDEDESGVMNLLLGGEHEFRLRCPPGYPHHEENFFVESHSSVRMWCNALNEYLLDAPVRLTLSNVLNKASSLHHSDRNELSSSDVEMDMSEEEDEEIEEEQEESHEETMLSDDDSTFTTEWELAIARKKKRWTQREAEIREQLKRAKATGPTTTELGAIQASGQDKEQAKQIFTSNAAFGILANDLVKILEAEKELGFSAEPIDDNIYQWCVKLYNFAEKSTISRDLAVIQDRFGYSYIQLQLDFAIDLYPFYPPLVKVIRPRLQDAMMQRVTNMEMLKLSYWDPAKDMKTVLLEMKDMLQRWARIDVDSPRNDSVRYPNGSYVDIEHHLLRLALVSEVNPRANTRYAIEITKPASKAIRQSSGFGVPSTSGKKEKQYWKPGTGYGHGNVSRPGQMAGWDVNAYIAAQKEKDKQIEAVLEKIHQELRKLFVEHCPYIHSTKSTVPAIPLREGHGVTDLNSTCSSSTGSVKTECNSFPNESAIATASSSSASSANASPKSCKPFCPISMVCKPSCSQSICEQLCTVTDPCCSSSPGGDSKKKCTRPDTPIIKSCNAAGEASTSQLHRNASGTADSSTSASTPCTPSTSAETCKVKQDYMASSSGVSSGTDVSLQNYEDRLLAWGNLLVENGAIDPITDMFVILEGSALVPFIETHLKADSFLEIGRHVAVYKGIVDIIREIACIPQLVKLLCALPDQDKSVYLLLEGLEQKARTMLQHMHKAANGSIPKKPEKVEPEPMQPFKEFIILYRQVADAVRRHGEAQLARDAAVAAQASAQEAQIECTPDITAIASTSAIAKSPEKITTSMEETYKKDLKEMQFDNFEFPLEGSSAHHYSTLYNKFTKPIHAQIVRIAQEFSSLSSSLPLELSSSIFVRVDDEKMNLMQALITGPEGTPYSGGCYQFDIFFPPNYPKVPPQVNLQTTGGGTVRFNPNLYSCGKVCLSLLGTWEGQQGEQWNETSSVLQVLVSIQSLILVPEPFFNEPGYEQEIGTDTGKRHSREYNADVRVNNIKHAIISQIQKPPPAFENVIKAHFFIKKEWLMKEFEDILKESPKDKKLSRALQDLKSEFKKLQKPQVASDPDSK